MTRGYVSRLTVATFVCFAGCSAPARNLTVPTHVTHVEITGRSMSVLRRIEDPAKIAQIVDFVRAHRSGWTALLGGPPIGRLSANFYDGKTFVGHFSVGPRFFETDLAGNFRSLSASDSDTSRFLFLIDMRGTRLDDPETQSSDGANGGLSYPPLLR